MDVLSDRKLGKKHSKPLHLLYSFSMTKSYQTKKDYKKKKKTTERREEFGFPKALPMGWANISKDPPQSPHYIRKKFSIAKLASVFFVVLCSSLLKRLAKNKNP